MFCDEHGTLDYCPYCMDEERALEINTELLEALEAVLVANEELHQTRIKYGVGWQLNGALLNQGVAEATAKAVIAKTKGA